MRDAWQEALLADDELSAALHAAHAFKLPMSTPAPNVASSVPAEDGPHPSAAVDRRFAVLGCGAQGLLAITSLRHVHGPHVLIYACDDNEARRSMAVAYGASSSHVMSTVELRVAHEARKGGYLKGLGCDGVIVTGSMMDATGTNASLARNDVGSSHQTTTNAATHAAEKEAKVAAQDARFGASTASHSTVPAVSAAGANAGSASQQSPALRSALELAADIVADGGVLALLCRAPTAAELPESLHPTECCIRSLTISYGRGGRTPNLLAVRCRAVIDFLALAHERGLPLAHNARSPAPL